MEILTISFPGAALSFFLFFKYFFCSTSMALSLSSISRSWCGPCPSEHGLPQSKAGDTPHRSARCSRHRGPGRATQPAPGRVRHGQHDEFYRSIRAVLAPCPLVSTPHPCPAATAYGEVLASKKHEAGVTPIATGTAGARFSPATQLALLCTMDLSC